MGHNHVAHFVFLQSAIVGHFVIRQNVILFYFYVWGGGGMNIIEFEK